MFPFKLLKIVKEELLCHNIVRNQLKTQVGSNERQYRLEILKQAVKNQYWLNYTYVKVNQTSFANMCNC